HNDCYFHFVHPFETFGLLLGIVVYYTYSITIHSVFFNQKSNFNTYLNINLRILTIIFFLINVKVKILINN
ncbi:MAG: hypothetical protein E7E51_01285, partial [Staphylococcus epidermidis]|nr:hypothetical protein [Staphylococcus epidermidis]